MGGERKATSNHKGVNLLRLLENISAIADAQKFLERRMREIWKQTGRRLVVWRPASKVLPISHNSTYWFASQKLSDVPIPRYWNSFGIFNEKGNLEIGVEVNAPIRSSSGSIAGFFATDDLGNTYLLHDGSVGGGRKGVNRASFLSYLVPELIPVRASDGSERQGILVAGINSSNFKRQVEHFVQSVVDFKAAVKSGTFAKSQAGKQQFQYGKYFDEFSGTKRRAAQAEVEYITRHGDIVAALRNWRHLSPGEVEVKSVLIDWGVQSRGSLTELYEVKTSCLRQTLYTGLGQLLTHGRNCKQFLVLPKDEDIPKDILTTIDAMNIAVIRYKLTASHAQILD